MENKVYLVEALAFCQTDYNRNVNYKIGVATTETIALAMIEEWADNIINPDNFVDLEEVEYDGVAKKVYKAINYCGYKFYIYIYVSEMELDKVQ